MSAMRCLPVTSPFQREHSGRGPQLPQQPGWGYAFPMLPSANDSAQQGTGAGPLPPNMEPLKRTILTRAPYGQLKFSQSCPIVWSSFYLTLLPSLSPFPGVRPASWAGDLAVFPCFFSPLYFTSISPNKFLAFLLPGLPDLMQLLLHMCSPGFLAVLQTPWNCIYSRVFAKVFSSLWNVLSLLFA